MRRAGHAGSLGKKAEVILKGCEKMSIILIEAKDLFLAN